MPYYLALKKFFSGKHFRVLEQVKGTNLLWFGDNNNCELKIIGGKTKQTTYFLVDTLKEVLFL